MSPKSYEAIATSTKVRQRAVYLIEAGDDLYAAFIDRGNLTKGQMEAISNYAAASNAFRHELALNQQEANNA